MVGASPLYTTNQSNNQSRSTLLNNPSLYYRNDQLCPYLGREAVGFNIDLIVLLQLHSPLTYSIPGNPLLWNPNLIQNSEIQNIIIYSE